MSFVGKILVVIQLVLSVLFMAFAGAVYSAHQNWRKTALKNAENEKRAVAATNDLQKKFDDFKDEKTKEVNASLERAVKAEAELGGVKQTADQLATEKKNLTVALATAQQNEKVADDEAKARRDEALVQREINTKLLASRDTLFKEKTRLEDELQGSQTTVELAQGKVKDLLTHVAMYRRMLEANNISTEPSELAMNISLPPRVEGKILEVRTPHERGKTELVEISVGSDDGLAVGHEFYVYRSGLETGEKGKYLSKIKVVYTTPDRSVAEVLDHRNGIIRRGDNVKTKL